MFHDPVRNLAVPELQDRAFLPLPGHQARECRWKLSWISLDQFVGADGDGFWAFAVVAKDRVGLLQQAESIELACGLIECGRRITAAQSIS
jgi:hypothetical protein